MDRIAAEALALLDFFERHPVFVTLVLWPVLTGLLSYGQDTIKARAPRAWTFLQTAGLDAAGLQRRIVDAVRKRKPKIPPPLPLLCILLAGCTPMLCAGCTPQQTQTAVDVSRAAADVAGAVCDELEGPDSSPIVRMLCRAADVAGDVIGNTATGEQGLDRPAPERVEVPREELAAFCRRNTCRAK